MFGIRVMKNIQDEFYQKTRTALLPCLAMQKHFRRPRATNTMRELEDLSS